MKLHSLDYLFRSCVGEYQPARVVYNGLDVTNPFEWTNSSSLTLDLEGVVRDAKIAKIANIDTTRWQMPKVVVDAMDVNVKRVYDELYDVKRQVECLLVAVDVDVWTDVYSDTFFSIAMYMASLRDKHSREVWYGDMKDLLLCWLLDFTSLDGERFSRLLHDEDAKRFMFAYKKLSSIFWRRGIPCGGVHLFFPAHQEYIRRHHGQGEVLDWSLDRESGDDYYYARGARVNIYGHTYVSYVKCLRYFYDVIESDEYRRTSVYRACVDNVRGEYEYILLKYLCLDKYIMTPISMNDEERNEVERKIKERLEDFLLPVLKIALRLRECNPNLPIFEFRGLFWVLESEFPRVWESLQASVEVGETEADENDETEQVGGEEVVGNEVCAGWVAKGDELVGELVKYRVIGEDDGEVLRGWLRVLVCEGKVVDGVCAISTKKAKLLLSYTLYKFKLYIYGHKQEGNDVWRDFIQKVAYTGSGVNKRPEGKKHQSFVENIERLTSRE